MVTMSYLGADEAVPHYGLMGPVKAALESLVRYMALELGPQGVRVYAVSPGPILTRAASGIEAFDTLMQNNIAQEDLDAWTPAAVGERSVSDKKLRRAARDASSTVQTKRNQEQSEETETRHELEQ